MDRNSRSFKMLLALNKQQKDKIEQHKRGVMLRNKATIADDDNDPDFILSDSDQETSGMEDEFYSLDSGVSTSCIRSQSTSKFQRKTTEVPELLEANPKPNINILSDITLKHSSNNNFTSCERGSNDIEILEENTFSHEAENKVNDSTAFIIEILQNMITNAMENSEHKNFTKKGELRKRKKYDLSPTQRKLIKLDASKAKHNVKSSCNKAKCKRKCSQKIDKDRQTEINEEFWKLNRNEQKNFILSSASREGVKRKTTGNSSRRSNSFIYYLKDTRGCKQIVCKVFFLATLGYDSKNDRVVRDALNKTNSGVTAKSSQQGKKGKMKIDRNIIMKHVESFKPTVAHYRREHAPERRYLPSDINITIMYNDFKTKYPNINFSYYLYREVVSTMKISFVKLGHEECWACESFILHSKVTSHKKDALDENCDDCNNFAAHQIKYRSARKEYQNDSSTKTNTDEPVVVSVDLQKVSCHLPI